MQHLCLDNHSRTENIEEEGTDGIERMKKKERGRTSPSCKSCGFHLHYSDSALPPIYKPRSRCELTRRSVSVSSAGELTTGYT